MSVNPLPEILEIKAALTGRRKEFRCRLLARDPRGAVVLFVSDAAYQVADLALPAGTVTFGHFWTDRPYNVYHWLRSDGGTLAFYFNVADRTELAGDVLRWRDLTVDILVRDGRAQVLDEDELPAGLDAETRDYIDGAKAQVLQGAATLGDELERAADALWPRAFAVARP